MCEQGRLQGTEGKGTAAKPHRVKILSEVKMSEDKNGMLTEARPLGQRSRLCQLSDTLFLHHKHRNRISLGIIRIKWPEYKAHDLPSIRRRKKTHKDYRITLRMIALTNNSLDYSFVFVSFSWGGGAFCRARHWTQGRLSMTGRHSTPELHPKPRNHSAPMPNFCTSNLHQIFLNNIIC